MKVLNNLIVVSMAIISLVQADQQCLYCKRVDTNAGFLFSYSYCPDTDASKCIQDYWNYIGNNFECVGYAQ